MPAIAGAAVSHADLVLEASDGTRLRAFAALPDGDPTAGVVVLPDVRGLHRFYEEVALRFAERGIAAVVVDYFGRTAGVGPRGDDFDFMSHVRQTTQAGFDADVRAAVHHLQAPAGGACDGIFTVGFCLGGRQSWLAAAAGHGLAGAVGFYGRPGAGADGTPGPTQRVGGMTAPILGLMGGADEGIPATDVAAFDAALTAAGVEHELVIYPGAPHSFFDRRFDEFADACADAWRRVLEFVAHHAAA